MDLRINPDYAPTVYVGIGSTALAAASLVFSKTESTKIIAATVLLGAGYGIGNNLFGCADCIHFYTVDLKFHGESLEESRGFRLVETLDPNINGFVWGMTATWFFSTIAGYVLAFCARAPWEDLPLKIKASQLAPYMAGAAIPLLFVAQAISQIAKNNMASVQQPEDDDADDGEEGQQPGMPRRHVNLLYPGVPPKWQAGWHSCETRNSVGYLGLVLGTVALSAATIAARHGIIRL